MNIILLTAIIAVGSGCSRIDWTELSPDGAFAVSMPGQPSKREALIPAGILGELPVTFYSVNVGNANFSVAYTDYPDGFVETSGVEVMLGAGVRKLAADPINHITLEDSVISQGCPSRKVEMESPQTGYATIYQSYLSGRRVYVVQVIQPKTLFRSRTADHFMESFTIQTARKMN